MPYNTPDASAFIRMKKLNAIQENNVNDVKYLTHLYQYVPRTNRLPIFLTNPTTANIEVTRNKLGMTSSSKSFIYVRQKYIR